MSIIASSADVTAESKQTALCTCSVVLSSENAATMPESKAFSTTKSLRDMATAWWNKFHERDGGDAGTLKVKLKSMFFAVPSRLCSNTRSNRRKTFCPHRHFHPTWATRGFRTHNAALKQMSVIFFLSSRRHSSLCALPTLHRRYCKHGTHPCLAYSHEAFPLVICKDNSAGAARDRLWLPSVAPRSLP